MNPPQPKNFWTMSQRAAQVEAAYKWRIPLNLWDGTGPIPTEEQKVEMFTYVKARQRMDAWEDHVNYPKDKKGISIGG